MKTKKTSKNFLKDIDRLAFIRTVLALGSFVIQLCIAVHLFGILQ